MKIITLINTVNLILLVWVFFTITEESKISNRTFISKPIHTSIDNHLEDLSGETKQLTILYTMSCHRGHINPNAAIARELISRNHKVDILMTGLCAETARALMPDANNVIALDIHPQKCLDPGDFLDMIASARELYIEKHTIQAFNATLEQLRRENYDILVGNFVVPGGIIAAKVSEIPVVTSTVGPFFVLFKEDADNWDFEVQINLPLSLPPFLSFAIRAILSISNYFLFSPIFNFIQEQHSNFDVDLIPDSENDGSLPFSYYYRHTVMINQGLPQMNLKNFSKYLEHDNVYYSGFKPDNMTYPKITEQALADFLRDNKKPVIYMSLGTVFDIGEKPQMDLLRQLDNQTRFKFVWAVLDKYNAQLKQAQTNQENLFIGSYLPQGSILLESDVKIFLTHCGANSVQDAIYAGKPMLTFSGFGDQVILAKRIAEQNMGIRLSELKLESIESALDTMLENNEYTKMVKNIENKRDFMMSLGGNQKSADVIEKTASGAIQVQKSVSQNLGSYGKVARTLALILVTVLVTGFTIVSYICYRICRRCRRKLKKE